MNRGKPSDDPSKIRGEILSSGDPLTLPLTYIWGLLQEKILSFSSTLGGADTPARITSDGYKNGGEVKSTRRHSGMNVDPSGGHNHSGPGRGGDTSLS
ncbi:unnamed protein product [Triticum turgidum subsp. durum]|uniref:Uncharacterized protein n=1 Tax=Triticum turgidum subsp. durum TaxID=4567 RepID=A0A9R0RUV9_TRITD|nr:unnamed protein product [Triticum turgidum subsp. durum]